MGLDGWDGMGWGGMSRRLFSLLYKRVSLVLATLALVLAGSCSETSAGIGWRFD